MQKVIQGMKRYFLTLDYILLILALLCSAFGLVLIFSATHAMDDGSQRYMLTQSAAIILGLIGFALMVLIDFQKYARLWRVVLLVNILFQLSLLLFGHAQGGNRSWLRFGPIGIQPAEVGKLLFIFTFAKHLNVLRYRLNRVRSLVELAGHLIVIMAAIVIPSHDVGMALPYAFICIVMLFGAGVSLKWFTGGVILACAAVPLLWNALSSVQQQRILVLFDPSIAPNTYWQQQQSLIAIGSGKLMGTGFLNGTQTQYNMLPEKQTDFIYGVAGEEWGFLGCLVILILLLCLIFRTFVIAHQSRSQFRSLLCIGIGGMYLYQTFENIFMCLGIGPVMGITLPFFSYGGSSVVTMYLALGMAASVTRRNRLEKKDGDDGEGFMEAPKTPQHARPRIRIDWGLPGQHRKT